MELSEPLFFFNFLSLSVSLSLSLSPCELHLRGLAKQVRCGTDGSWNLIRISERIDSKLIV
jgi:hypothetical protein